jgi:hypothetical protein
MRCRRRRAARRHPPIGFATASVGKSPRQACGPRLLPLCSRDAFCRLVPDDYLAKIDGAGALAQISSGKESTRVCENRDSDDGRFLNFLAEMSRAMMYSIRRSDDLLAHHRASIREVELALFVSVSPVSARARIA